MEWYAGDLPSPPATFVARYVDQTRRDALSVLAASGGAVKVQYSDYSWSQYVEFADVSDASAGINISFY